jgi:hypothetical protein
MGRVFRRFFEDLLAGDPVALIAGAVILAVALPVCLYWWKTARDLRREDEQRKQRHRGKKKT